MIVVEGDVTGPRPDARADATAAGTGGDAPDATRIRHLPGLDGLRGVAIAGVFLFHAGAGWMTGAWLAVSTFFTLSGFLITTLLLRERAATGTIRIGRFWERRIRRLLPAAALGVALAAVATFAVGTPGQQQSFAGDGLATLADVANWRFVLAAKPYAALFSAPSALQHAWSLAIEAQFYWLYPLVTIAALRAVRGSRRWFGLLLLALAAGSVALSRVAGFGHDRVYYGTDTRAAELLAGSLLAVLVAGRAGGVGAPWPSGARRAIGTASTAAGVAVLVCWWCVPAAADWVEAGGLAVYALASSLVVLGAAVAGSPVARLLSLRPLRALGRVSYGAYLFHWPVLMLLAPDRVPLPEPMRVAAAAAATVALAAVSYRLVELPVRTRQGALGIVPLRWAAAGCAAVALVPTFAVARHAPDADGPARDLAAGSLVDDLDRLGPADRREVPMAATSTDATAGGTAPPTTAAPDTTHPPDTTSASAADTTAALAAVEAPGPTGPKPIGPLAAKAVVRPSRPLRVLVVGDSTALYLDPLIHAWGQRNGVWAAANYARMGCGIARAGAGRIAFGDVVPDARCDDWPAEWPGVLARTAPDLIVLASSFWEATDRKIPGDDTWRRPGDPVWDAFVADEYRAALDLLARAGVPIAWLDHPPISFKERSDYPLVNPQLFDPARMARLDDLQREVARGRPLVRVVHTREFLQRWPGGMFDPALRPDGLHIDGPGATPLVDWLGPELLDTYWAVRQGR